MKPPQQGHDHQLPRSLLALVALCIVGLLAGVVLSYVYAQNVNARLGRLEQYVQGKGVDRDKEQRRLEEENRRATCDLLDQLPAGGLLERPRVKYHCGPGIPLASLPPDVRRRYAGTSVPLRPSPPPATTAPSARPTSPSSPPPHSPPSPTAPASSPLLPELCRLLPTC